MRKRRETILSPFREEQSSIYHCVSRVVNRDFVFGDEEREMFVLLMRRYEAFCGVKVLSYCVMSNHFHILVKVPPICEQEIDDEVILERMSGVYSKAYVANVEQNLKKHKKNHATKAARTVRETFTKRMCDLSEFMKMLKWRFSCWFNKKNSRVGTLWESRFKSVLVEDGVAARTMSAYIDLNPVRAGMVADPKDYRWCSYAEAVAGGTQAQAGIKEVVQSFDAGKISRGIAQYDARKKAGKIVSDAGLKKAQRRVSNAIDVDELSPIDLYRMVLFEEGEECLDDNGKVARKGIKQERVEQMLADSGKRLQLSKSEMLRCRVRYFTDGAVIGSKRFVNDFFEHSREFFGEHRKTGARKMQGVEKIEGDTMHVLRDLKKDVYS